MVSPRFHNLVMALIQNKPVIALSDHAKTGFADDRFRVGAVPRSLGRPDPKF